MEYGQFLEQKKQFKTDAPSIHKDPGDLSPILYDFQRDIVSWSLRHGRTAMFEDCGLGKSLQQLEWSNKVGGTVLIVAPLSVAEQTVKEALKIDTNVNKIRHGDEIRPGINITNYEMIKSFTGIKLDGMVLDESSILKSIDGKTRGFLLDNFIDVPFKLCCTATPCPNDISELANHAQFLNIMTRQEMLASFFVHDQDGWRLRGHAQESFYRWLSTWSMSLKKPSDLGYDDGAFELPELTINDVVIPTEWRRPGELFPGNLKGITDRSQVRRQSIGDRVKRAAEIANDVNGDQLIIWCGLNEESKQVSSMVNGGVEITGADSMESKIEKINGFLDGRFKVLITKPKIAGFGMNFQNANHQIFLGLSDSFESYYQCIRRSWRYGQEKPVHVDIVVTDHEEGIVENVKRKEAETTKLYTELIENARVYEMEELGRTNATEEIERSVYKGDDWTLYQGDCVEEMKQLRDESIDLSVFSPPFLSLYTYSASEADIGNSFSHDSFFQHFGYAITEIKRITKPGRLCAVHVAQVPATLVNNGYIGLMDFRGDTIKAFEKDGWVYQGEVVIDKDPQAQAIRTHAKGLLFVQLKKDASWLRPALADYILVFRKPGENAVPIKPDITNDMWIEWARPIWYGIRESDTLNTTEAKSDKDDRHICPLQLGTIERVIALWSNLGETIFSPFAGIGSEGYQAVKMGRKFIGIELKPLYAETAAKNLNLAVENKIEKQANLFKGQ